MAGFGLLAVMLLVISAIAVAGKRDLLGVSVEVVSGWVIILTLIGTVGGIVKLSSGQRFEVVRGATLLLCSLACLGATVFYLARRSVRKGRGPDGR
jgi:hypothetical protein